jgi:transposase
MPKPYSLDLRERVVRHVDEGHSRRAAAAHFTGEGLSCAGKHDENHLLRILVPSGDH